ncbi:MAG: Phosphate transport system substrate-binding protein [Gammaproteobacteria bacterium]|nr:Phosphate transport system substrate-binding protein [Gammaproteobacteria bacterium]
MTRRVLALAVLLLATAAAPATEVDQDLPAYMPTMALEGELRVSGGDTMRPLVEAWARKFQVLHPKATVRVDSVVSLAADGFAALLQGQVELVAFVREPFRTELTEFKQKFGYPLRLINVAGGSFATKSATHALAIYVNAANPLTRLTLAQLDAVLSTTRRRRAPRTITTWGQLGVKGEWSTHLVQVYGMLHLRDSGNPPGIVNFIQQRVLLGGEFRSDIHEQIDRPGDSALQGIVRAIAADANGIGYSGFGYAVPNTKTLALAESAAGPFYSGSVVEVTRRSYPLSRQIYFGVNCPPGQPLAALSREFITFALSREGQDVVGSDAMGFLPLTAPQAAAARREVE